MGGRLCDVDVDDLVTQRSFEGALAGGADVDEVGCTAFDGVNLEMPELADGFIRGGAVLT